MFSSPEGTLAGIREDTRKRKDKGTGERDDVKAIDVSV